MPSRNSHEEQATRNGSLGQALWEAGEHKDWAVTAFFYEALHAVEMYFAHKLKKHPKTHTERQPLVKSFLPRAWRDYRDLEENSRLARYECAKFADADVQELSEARDKVRAEVDRLLK